MRKNTQLESSGAEFLVLGNLLIEGISAYKTYHNFKGYDLVAVNAENNSSARIQVKSRYTTQWDGFIINNFDCDFVVLVTLNRGFSKIKANGDDGKKSPDCYVFPISYIMELEKEKSKWSKIQKAKMLNYKDYLNRWELISKFLATKPTTVPKKKRT